eukprot:1399078-Rhodomonas_salina.1
MAGGQPHTALTDASAVPNQVTLGLWKAATSVDFYCAPLAVGWPGAHCPGICCISRARRDAMDNRTQGL